MIIGLSIHPIRFNVVDIGSNFIRHDFNENNQESH